MLPLYITGAMENSLVFNKMRALVISCAFLASCSAFVPGPAKQDRKFPEHFQFGVATASYQIEGAWNADDKSESIWDHYLHGDPSLVDDFSNGDIAADSYHNFQRDIEMMRELGVNRYRFSISWPRVLPTGFANKVSKAGIAFYNNYINEMMKYNITPIVTMFHWDLPESLQKLGGFASPLFAEWFEDYARVLYGNFGDRVRHWITFNEPNSICHSGYGEIELAPFLNSSGIGEYLCAKNLLIAHARAYHAFVNDYKNVQNGKIAMTIYIPDISPLTDSEEDMAAAELAKQFSWRLYAEPIFSKAGGWPKEFEKRINEKSKNQGYPKSRLPAFTNEETDLVKGSADFFCVNHYTASKKSANKNQITFTIPSLDDDLNVGSYYPEEWPGSASNWLRMAPHSMYNVLMDIKHYYDNPSIGITENGWATEPGADLNDEDRVKYYRAMLNGVLDALESGVNVRSYMAWSLMDNFEWLRGYTSRFGLYEVDMKSPNRTRTPRKSAYVYKEIIRSKTVDYSYEPDITQPLTIDEGH